MRRGLTTALVALTAFGLLWGSSSGASAQAPGAGRFTGYELALYGSTTVRAERTARFHGVAYRVRGLSTLEPFAGPVRARYARGPADDGDHGDDGDGWVDVVAGADGRFVLDVPIPARDPDHEAPLVVFRVGPDGTAREFEQRVEVEAALQATLRTDRVLYEAREPVHGWLLLRDAATGRPVAGRSVQMVIDTYPFPRIDRTVVTNAAGVAHIEVSIADGAAAGDATLRAIVAGQLEATTDFRVGTRTWERLVVDVETTPAEVPPGGTAVVNVRVTTPSGSPVREAAVDVTVGRQHYQGTTGDTGLARISVVAPSYLASDRADVRVRAEVSHPAHGSAVGADRLRLAVPLSLEVEVIADNGGLVPEAPGRLFVRLRDGAGEPPPIGTEVTVEGPAMAGGRSTALTDVHGLAEVPTRLPRGASLAGDAETPTTNVVVHVAGPLERIARLPVPVLRGADVAVRLDAAAYRPGARVEARLDRRPGARNSRVLVELLDDDDRIIAVRVVGPTTRLVTFDLPARLLGLLRVRARALRAGETLAGGSASAMLIVRPASPDFVALEPEQPRFLVGETAQVHLRTTPNGPPAFAAVVVRDLSAHGGERPFDLHYISQRFDRALLDPNTPAADRLLRTALSAYLTHEPSPREAPPLTDRLGLPSENEAYSGALSKDALRDPYPLARELERRGVARAMTAAEGALTDALDSGDLDAVSTGRGAARRFREDLYEQIGAYHVTLGDQPLTPGMIESVDPSFSFEHAARRVARHRLVSLMVSLARYLDPGDDAAPRARMADREPFERWLPRMIERGVIDATELDDPWGGRFVLTRTRAPVIVLGTAATGLELVSPGPDGRPGTRDDVRDPFERVIPTATPYAVASGEDELMRSLSVLSVTSEAIEALLAAFSRGSVEMAEEEIGDAVSAEVGEATIGLGNLGTIGHGGGGGSGSGYGRGAGGLRGRGARAPRVRGARAAISGLASIVRERFPPTLLFVPSVEVEASGTTTIPIPLSDAVTTYLVEAMVWRTDGWCWSAETRIEVDREIVVDAPIPAVAHRQDVLTLPLRVANRGSEPRELILRLTGDDAIGVPDSPGQRVTVPAGDATRVPVRVTPSRAGEGHLTVIVTTPEGEALDAVRRRVRVIEPTRRVGIKRDRVAVGRAVVTFDVPGAATGRDAALRVVVGDALFAARPTDELWALWAPGAGQVRARGGYARSVPDRALLLASRWGDDTVTDDELRTEIFDLTRRVDRSLRDAAEPAELSAIASTLLTLEPVAGDLDARPEVPQALQVIETLRAAVGTAAAGQDEAPALWVRAAAALAATAPEGASPERVAELVRRLRRHVVVVGDDRWLVTERFPVRATLMLAMAEAYLGRRQEATDLLATVARWGATGHSLDGVDRALSRVAVRLIQPGAAPERMTIFIDGRRRVVPLEGGRAELEVPELARPGSHRIVAVAPGGALVSLEASARYGMPWAHAFRDRGPFAVAIEGEAGGVDEVAELELVLGNRVPRTHPRPVVEVALPTGAELPIDARREIERFGSLSVDGGVLHIELAPLRPGRELRIPLGLRFTVGGRLVGLGVAAWSSDRPERPSLVRPSPLELSGGSR